MFPERVIPYGDEFDEILFMNVISVGEDAPPHDVEHDVAK
jgi:hypothetical protein